MVYLRIQKNEKGAMIAVSTEQGQRQTAEQKLAAELAEKQAVREAAAPALKQLDTNADEYVSVREIEAGLESGAVTVDEVAAAEAERENPRAGVEQLVAEAEAEEEFKQRADGRFLCPHCDEFTAARVGGLKQHIAAKHAE